MKTNKILKVMCIIILILILIMISFVGIYVKDNGRLVNIIKDFTTASEFGVEKEYLFSVSEATETEHYDADGNLVAEEDVDEDAEEGTYTTKEFAINPDEAKRLYDYMNNALKVKGVKTETGIFGADMKVEIYNDGPVTIVIDSNEL